MPFQHLQVLADDLSGAAECAAALARTQHAPVPLVLQGELPATGSWALDTDSRVQPAAVAAVLSAQAMKDAAARRPAGALLFKKIDSTLRGHIAQELRATLAVPGLFQAAVVCPALPAQGRTLKNGILHMYGEPQVDRLGLPLDLPRLLVGADARPQLVRPAPGMSASELAQALAEAVRSGGRVLVVDAQDNAQLHRLAQALVTGAPGLSVLAVGSAGLAHALAGTLAEAGPAGAAGVAHAPRGMPAGVPPAATGIPTDAEAAGAVRLEPIDQAPPGGAAVTHGLGDTSAAERRGDAVRLELSGDGPLVAMVGSFSPVSGLQLEQLAHEPGVALVRLNASTWIAQPQAAADQLAAAAARVGPAGAVVLAATGAVPALSTRELVKCMAKVAEPLVRSASCLVLTGGDTARTVLDRLGIERLQVLGELEPGICLSHVEPGAQGIVTKAGGFGDALSLVRVVRQFRAALTRDADKPGP